MNLMKERKWKRMCERDAVGQGVAEHHHRKVFPVPRDKQGRSLIHWKHVPIRVMNHITTLAWVSKHKSFFMIKGQVVMNCWYREEMKKQKDSSLNVMHIYANLTSKMKGFSLLWKWLKWMGERQGDFVGCLTLCL